MNISWSMKRNRRHKLSFRCAVSGFVATCDISLCRYRWLWSFLYRRNSRAASSNQNVRANKLNLVLSCAFRYDEFKTVKENGRNRLPYFIYILPAISAEWHRQFAHDRGMAVAMTGWQTPWFLTEDHYRGKDAEYTGTGFELQRIQNIKNMQDCKKKRHGKVKHSLGI